MSTFADENSSALWWRHAPVDVDSGRDSSNRARFLCYSGPTSDADFRDSAARPGTWISGVEHVVCGLEIPHLPEPFSADLSRASRADASRQHRGRLASQFSRIVNVLYLPALFRGRDQDWQIGHYTFDFRILNSTVGCLDTNNDAARSGSIAPSQIRLLLLVRVAVRCPSGSNDDDARRAAQTRAVELGHNVCRQIRALAPRELTFRDIHWQAGDEASLVEEFTVPTGSNDNRSCWLRPSEAWLEPGDGEGIEVVDIRRAYWINRLRNPRDKTEYSDALDMPISADGGGGVRAIHYPWPSVDCSLMPTLAAIAASDQPAGLVLRIRPTAKTDIELSGLSERWQELEKNGDSIVESSARGHAVVTLLQEELFQASVQVAAQDANALQEIAATYIGEHQLDKLPGLAESPRRFAVVRALDSEREIAWYNLVRMEMIPWGSFRLEDDKAMALYGSRPADAPDVAFVAQQFELQKPEVFLARNAERNVALMRLRSLVTMDEAMCMWRLPVPEPGGQAGVVSRLPNPFEQLPEEIVDDGDAISMGIVQHRGSATGLHFRLPLILPKSATVDVAGVGDRVLVVAGSPGSGKTNFCLSFLGQLWDTRDQAGKSPRARYPYLVIDPTRGNEFRQLIGYADPDVLVFTVGDGRCSPLRFNPFVVPKDVSVQTHVSRLMSCFKAAYHMWDPLPAIFEMAIKRAYLGRRKSIWDQRNTGKPWLAAEDFPGGTEEPFPNLDDMIDAMGRGRNSQDPSKPEIWPVDGKPTVMYEQREMWGGETENAATIVASTFLRMNNLKDSFGHIIGAGQSDEPLIDLAKVLERPVVMEMGMIGDSQALSLIMAFLLACLRGTIETTGPELRKKARAEGGEWMNMLVIEEAHLLLSAESGGGGKEGGSSKAQAAEDINNMLAEVRKYGQGVMLLDQRPGSLVGGAIDNAYVICMHRLNEEKSFNQFSRLLNLTPDQQRFARTELRPGEMVTLDRRSGLPVLIRPPNERTDTQRLDDIAMRDEMGPRRAMLRQTVVVAPESRLNEEAVPSTGDLLDHVLAENPQLDQRYKKMCASLHELDVVVPAERAYDFCEKAMTLARGLKKQQFDIIWTRLLFLVAEREGVSNSVIQSLIDQAKGAR